MESHPPAVVLNETPEYNEMMKSLGIEPDELLPIPVPPNQENVSVWEFKEQRRQRLLHRLHNTIQVQSGEVSPPRYSLSPSRAMSARNQSERMINQRMRFERKVEKNLLEMEKMKKRLIREDAIAEAKHDFQMQSLREKEDRAAQYLEYEKVLSAMEVERRQLAETEAMEREEEKRNQVLMAEAKRKKQDAALDEAVNRREDFMVHRAQYIAENQQKRSEEARKRHHELEENKRAALLQRLDKTSTHEENKHLQRVMFLRKCQERNLARKETYSRAISAHEHRTQLVEAEANEKHKKLERWHNNLEHQWRDKIHQQKMQECQRKKVYERAQTIANQNAELHSLLQLHGEQTHKEHLAQQHKIRDDKINILRLLNEDAKKATERAKKVKAYEEAKLLKQWTAKRELVEHQEKAIKDMWDGFKRDKEKTWGRLQMMKDALRSKNISLFQHMLQDSK